jgi:hypothetical protein
MWSDDHASDENVSGMISQICYAAGITQEGCDDDEEEDNPFSMGDMREELDRLRSQIAESTAPRNSSSFLLNGPAQLPAAVPEVPSGLQVTDQMNVLVDTIISEKSQLRVAFWGYVTPRVCHMQPVG